LEKKKEEKKPEKLPQYATRYGLGLADYVSVCLRKTLGDSVSTLSINLDVPYEELEEKLKKIKKLFRQIW